MINIIVLHINLVSKELNYNYYSPRFQSIWLSETMAYWGVNGFGIISGIVGYKKHKFSNMIYIWIETFFYSTTISFYNYIKNKTIKRKQSLFISFLPIYIRYHWYVNAYICMYPFLPIINHGINNITRDLLRNVVIILVCFYSIYDMIVTIMIKKNDYHFINTGYTPLWLIILYIIGGYLGKYFLSKSKTTKITNHIFWILIYLCSSFFSYEIFFIILKKKYNIFCQVFICFTSPTILLQAFCLILVFSRISIKNCLMKKIISFFVPLTFNITLLHLRLMSENYYYSLKFIEYFKKLHPKFLLFKTYGLAILIYLFCAFIDYFRFLLFKILGVKDFCILIENKMPILTQKILNLF
jgi:hypothetical protein